MSITRRITASLTGLLIGIAGLLLTAAPSAIADSDWPPAPAPVSGAQLSDLN